MEISFSLTFSVGSLKKYTDPYISSQLSNKYVFINDKGDKDDDESNSNNNENSNDNDGPDDDNNDNTNDDDTCIDPLQDFIISIRGVNMTITNLRYTYCLSSVTIYSYRNISFTNIFPAQSVHI